jgi:RND family efflux transporter MFP subunit
MEFVFLLLSLLFSFSIVSCNHKPEGNISPPTLNMVKFKKIKFEKVIDLYESPGNIRAKNISIISSKVRGKIKKIFVEEGDTVEKGSPLIFIDVPELLVELEKGKEMVRVAERDLIAIKERAKFIRSTYNRYKNLLMDNAITKHEFEDIETRKNISEEEILKAEARLREAKKELERRKILYSYTKILSPIKGLVTEKYKDIGSMANIGDPILKIESNKNFRLEVSIDEKLVNKVKVEERIPVIIEAINKKIEGKISKIVPSIDSMTRTFIIKVNIPDNYRVKSGMYGKALIPVGEKKVILIPKFSIKKVGQLSGVYTLENNNLIRLRFIKTGKVYGNNIEVLSGLDIGDKIITYPLDKVFDGIRAKKSYSVDVSS